LLHRTVYAEAEKFTVKLPFGEELEFLHPDGFFPLVEDPTVTQRALILGMFVLRPGRDFAFVKPLLIDDGLPSREVYHPDLEWAYNFEGLEGGWLIANCNGIDAYRLGMQYALSDAVIIGSNSVSLEGVELPNRPAYIWQPYFPLSWGQVSSIDPKIQEKVANTRLLWQERGYLSSRKYPAQVVFTWTGLKYDNSPDFLDAAIFHRKHPDGTPIEVYIITSQLGAERIRSRCQDERLEDMLIILPPKAGQPNDTVDLTDLPKIFYEKYGMKICNHDGGHKVLLEFCRAGIIPQMNLTLGRKSTVKQVINTMEKITTEQRELAAQNFDRKLSYFFSYRRDSAGDVEGSETDNNDQNMVLSHGIPPDLPILAIIEDDQDEVAIYTFDTRGGFDYFRR
jgi:hypothetical protein